MKARLLLIGRGQLSGGVVNEAGRGRLRAGLGGKL